MYQSIPKPPIPPPPPSWAIPGHLTRIKLCTVGNLTQNEARLVGCLTSYQNVCQQSETKGFCNSLVQHVCHVQGSLLLSIPHGFFCCCRLTKLYCGSNMPLFKVWSENKLNKKFVVTENFADLVSTVALTCLEGGGI